MGTLPLGRAKIKMAGGGGEVPAGLRLPEDQQRRCLKIAGRIMHVSPQNRKPRMLADNIETAPPRTPRETLGCVSLRLEQDAVSPTHSQLWQFHGALADELG